MAKRSETVGATRWPAQADPSGSAFNGGEIWVGEHSVDRDILVFDPSEADASAARLSFYSLAQHRTRTFPRDTVIRMIQPVTDELGSARARKDYARRAELQRAHLDTLAADRVKRDESQRQGVLDSHRRHLASLGIDYQGVKDTAADRRPGRRTKCHACGIALDDFAGAVCGVCDGVLCSCGACACGGPTRSRSTQ